MILYLTKAERKLYDKLPASLRKAWGGEVAEEKGTACETAEELQTRAQLLMQENPRALRLGQKILSSWQRNGDVPQLDAQEVQNVLPEILMMMGCRGITFALIEMLQTIQDASELETAAAFSLARHHLLLSNALVRVAS